MKKFELTFCLWLVIALFMGCSQIQSLKFQVNSKYPKVLEIGSEVCEPPCWYGIIPGRTNLAETEKIIMGMDFFTNDGSIVLDETNSVITWYGGEGNNAYLYYQDEIIQMIHFYFKEGTSLGRILERFGEPNGYFLSEDDEAYVITIFYPERGIVFKASQEYSKPMSEKMLVFFGFYVPETKPESFLNQYVQLRNLDRPGFNLIGIDYTQWEGLGVCPKGLSFPELCEQ